MARGKHSCCGGSGLPQAPLWQPGAAGDKARTPQGWLLLYHSLALMGHMSSQLLSPDKHGTLHTSDHVRSTSVQGSPRWLACHCRYQPEVPHRHTACSRLLMHAEHKVCVPTRLYCNLYHSPLAFQLTGGNCMAGRHTHHATRIVNCAPLPTNLWALPQVVMLY